MKRRYVERIQIKPKKFDDAKKSLLIDCVTQVSDDQGEFVFGLSE
jgi:hypothetical protein